MSSLKPLADRVLVKPDEAEQKTASGLYIASNAQEKPQRGTIVAIPVFSQLYSAQARSIC